jgi:hypothetical protein
MKNSSLVLILGITFLCGSSSLAQRNSKPPQPFIDRGACPFECCTYRSWDVTEPTVVRKAMNERSPVAFRLK